MTVAECSNPEVQALYWGEHPETEAACLSTFGQAFAADATTGSSFYLGPDSDPQGRWGTFWSQLVQDTLAHAPQERVLHAVHAGEAAAVCTLWRKPGSVVNTTDTCVTSSAVWELLTEDGRRCFNECHCSGGLWCVDL